MASPRAQSRAARHEWVAPRPARRLRHTVAPSPHHPHHVVELAQCMRLIAISMSCHRPPLHTCHGRRGGY